MLLRVLAVALLTLLIGRAASAQAVSPTTTPHVDTVPPAHRLALDATKIQAAHYTYRLQLTRDTVTTPLGEQHFDVSETSYSGTPALMFARSGTQGVTATSDSLIVRRDDLRALHWIASAGPARLAAEFTPDSIFEAMTSPLGRQNVVLPNRWDVIANPMALDATLAALPLAASWRDSATTIVVDAGGAAITPMSIGVEGEERATVPAGEFDCWIVAVETERASARLWVTKQGQVVVRSEQILPELGGATVTRVLVQTDSPALMPASARLPQ
jgi:hypothetical protein